MKVRYLPLTLAGSWLTLLSLVALATSPARAESITLDYSTLTGLPDTTGQGLVYGTSTGTSESNTYSVANGALHVNTSQYGSDVESYYQATNSDNSALNAEMIVTTRVTANNSSTGLLFVFYDSTFAAGINVTKGGWGFDNKAFGTFAVPSQYHTYDLVTMGGTGAYTLTIDGTLASAGTLSGGYPAPLAVYFGDGTPTGGNVTGDIRYFSFNNPPSIVPEPASLAMVGTGLLASAFVLIRRGRKPAAC